MPINASELVVPGLGGDPGQSLMNLSNRLWMRNIQTQRLELAREGKREQSGNFLKDYLNPKDYLTGTQYDPALIQKLNAAMQKGSMLAEQGADIPTLLMRLGPDMAEIGQYTSKAKLVGKQIDDTIAKAKENGYKYNYGEWKDQALRSAFHGIDPKTGADTGLKDINDVDPSKNYALQILQDHPDRVATGDAIAEYAKQSPKSTRLQDIVTHTANGSTSRKQTEITAANFEIPEIDPKTGAVSLVPKYDHATDNGEPITHTFIGDDGKARKLPVRLFDEQEFNNMMGKRPDIADHIRAETMAHIKDYKDDKGQPIDLSDPRAHMVARAIAYDYLKSNGNSTVKSIQDLNKPSAAEIQLRVFGDRYQQSFDRKSGLLDAIDYSDTAAPSKPLNAIQVTHEIMNNNPTFVGGKVTQIQVGDKDRSVVDVTGRYPGGTLRFGHGEKETYQNIFYDPTSRSLIGQTKDHKYQEHPEGEMPAWLKSVAGANHLNPNVVDRSLSQAGYNAKSGKYANAIPNDAVDYVNSQVTKQRDEKVSGGLAELTTHGKGEALKGLSTPKGKITDAGERSWFNPGKYFIETQDKSGNKAKDHFDSREEMEDFINGNKSAAPTGQPAAPSTAPAATPKTKKDSDKELMDQYKL